MTPELKAKELLDKYYIICQEFTEEIQCSIQAKQCAFISVDQIMKAPHENCYMELISTDAENTDWFWNKFDEYWNEVKNEIEKL
jgi:hypothetical protein